MPTRYMSIAGEPTFEKHFDLDLLTRQEFFENISMKYAHIWDLIRRGPKNLIIL